MAFVKQILVLIFISTQIIFITCKNGHFMPSPGSAVGPTQLKDEPKDKPSDPSKLPFPGMAPESPDKKKGDSTDEKEDDSKKKGNSKKKGDSKDDKKGNSKKKDDSKDDKKSDSKKKDKDDKKRDSKKKDDSNNGESKKKGNSSDEKEGDTKKKGDSKKKDDSTDEKEGDGANEVANQMHKIEKKINEFNASLKNPMDNPESSPGSHECVLECDEVLAAAIDDIKKALDSLANQNLVKAKFDVSAVSTNVDTCNDCFDEMVGGDPTAKKLSDWVQKTTGDVLEALQKADS